MLSAFSIVRELCSHIEITVYPDWAGIRKPVAAKSFTNWKGKYDIQFKIVFEAIKK